MKKQRKYLFILFLIPFLMFSNGEKFTHTKQKNIKKTYLVNTDASLAITNSYGSITVIPWDEDKIDLDITIKVSSNNEKWINERLNDITVDISALKGLVSAKTIIGNSSSRNNGSNNNFEINYIIKIPRNSNNVNLNNKYGSIICTDLLSSTMIYCKYGKLTLGKLSSNNNDIQIEYCDNSSINYLNNGTIIAKYSDLNIQQINKLDLTSDYTDIDIQDANEVKYTCKYGDLNFQNIKNLDGLGNYLKIKVGNLNGNLKINTKYSDILIHTITAKASAVAIVSNYSNSTIGFDENFDFNFDVILSYANLKYSGDLTFINKEETNNTKKYSGYYKKKGSNLIKISSDYGNVSLIKKQ
ncbi:hypothetical protein HNP99_002148 [Flavobacterium sp. 28A]|uniref:hypothetical protein n=1 Tax=Flavobacterium sp. 28A TaxID=2735895 RepID=UPI00156D4C1C|nr:hypothetical protein [Flavobacterium sp. 28A]NRT15788.1 hypothetical protein [Flavobacterium sp. 28A]